MEMSGSAYPGLYTKYSQIFQESFLRTAIYWDKIASPFISTSEQEQHVWMDRIPQLRLWRGDRVIRNASLRNYTLVNQAYELTEELDEFKVKDNKIDSFAPLVRAMATQSKKWPDSLFFGPTGAIVSGSSFTTYDNQPFWSASHPVYVDNPSSVTQSNFQTSFPLNFANFFTALQTMQGYLGNDGLPLYVNPTLLVTTPSNAATARQILNQSFIAPAAQLGANSAGVMQGNPLIGAVDLAIVPDMAAITSVGGGSGTPWMLLDTSQAVKPFLFQMREAPEFVSNVRPDSPTVFARHALQYGVKTRGAGGYGPYFLAFLGIG